jgi:pyridoxal phosphate enzyme (YggS family)
LQKHEGGLSVEARLAEIRDRIVEAASDAGRDGAAIRLQAVSKTYPAAVIAEAVAAGQALFGENRVQELQEKQPELPSHLEWHLIGPLQRNKVRKVVGKCACLETIDSLKLAKAVSRIADEEGVVQRILLQLRIGGEDSKSGFEEEDLLPLLDELVALPALEIAGVMTIPPPAEKPSDARKYFAEMRGCRDRISERSGLGLSELSMGMSGDFEAAIAEGSTLVRVGSAIFGPR